MVTCRCDGDDRARSNFHPMGHGMGEWNKKARRKVRGFSQTSHNNRPYESGQKACSFVCNDGTIMTPHNLRVSSTVPFVSDRMAAVNQHASGMASTSCTVISKLPGHHIKQLFRLHFPRSILRRGSIQTPVTRKCSSGQG